MCWAACDRLARIAARLGLTERAGAWRERRRPDSSNYRRRAAGTSSAATFVSTFDGDALDASLLLLAELGFLDADDPRFAATVRAVERDLRRGDFIFRYVETDDFGEPENAFLVCTFWYVNALAALGRRDEARALFEKTAGLPQPPRPAGRTHRPAHRRAVGQLRADLQHGRPDQRRHPVVDSVGPGFLSAVHGERSAFPVPAGPPQGRCARPPFCCGQTRCILQSAAACQQVG